jgi:hypothetical protein
VAHWRPFAVSRLIDSLAYQEPSFRDTTANDGRCAVSVTRPRQRERLNSTQVGPGKPFQRSRKRTPGSFAALLRSDTQSGPTRRCRPDEYDVIVDTRFAMQ